MSEPDYALEDAALVQRCRVSAGPSGGPGGQHANRNATAVRVVHPSGVTAECGGMRERGANRSRALRRLRLRLACAQRGQAQRRWLDERRQGKRLPVTPKAQGYHLVVAVALDALAQAEGRLGPAAAGLDLSTSQLTRLLVADKEVRQAADALRAQHGHGPLR
ncbi:MAG: peptide chain release factor-like protein [Planctomycetota bacterium]